MSNWCARARQVHLEALAAAPGHLAFGLLSRVRRRSLRQGCATEAVELADEGEEYAAREGRSGEIDGSFLTRISPVPKNGRAKET